MTTSRALLAAVAALVAAGAIGVVVVGHGHASTAKTAGSSASANGAPRSGSASRPAGAPGGGTPTTAAGAAGGNASAASTWHIPAPGSYRFHYSRTGAGSSQYDASLVVAVQSSHAYTESRTENGVTTIRQFSLHDGALQQTGFVVQSKTGSALCRWDHPLTVVPAHPSAGHTWSDKSSCTLVLAGQRTTIQLESSWKVVGTRSAKVGNDTVPLLRIDGASTTRTSTDKGTIVRNSGSIDYFDLARGLLAQSTDDGQESSPSGQTTYRIVEAMLTLQPEVHR